VTAIAGVLVILTLLIAPYLRPWLAQRSEIAAGAARVEALQREVDALTVQNQRWADTAFVKAQARQRLHFVMPGEVGYVVLDDSPKPAKATDPRLASAAVPRRSPSQPWYSTLWQSVKIAGDPATERERSAP
jgi:cell division protein FtsB